MEELEEGFQGIYLATDTLWGVVLAGQGVNETFQVLGTDGSSLGNFLVVQMVFELVQVTSIGNSRG